MGPYGIAVDSAGDVFVTEYLLSGVGDVLELPKTSTGYGPQTTLPSSDLSIPTELPWTAPGMCSSPTISTRRVVELPKTATGYGPQTTLPASGLTAGPWGCRGQRWGCVHRRWYVVVELPRTATGYGPQSDLPASAGLSPAELPWTALGMCSSPTSPTTGWWNCRGQRQAIGPQTTLPTSGLTEPDGVAVDSAGDVFIADYVNDRVVELPKTATGYGPQTTLPFGSGLGADAVAVDSAGDLFVTDPARPHSGIADAFGQLWRRQRLRAWADDSCAMQPDADAQLQGHRGRHSGNSQGAHWRRARPRLHPGQRKHLHRRRGEGRNLHSKCDLCASGHRGSEGLG